MISNTRLNLAKNQAKTKQHPEVELLLFENYLLFSSMLSSKTSIRYSKNVRKNKCEYLNETISWLIILKRSEEIKNRWHRYDINQTSLNEYAKYKICLSIMMIMCKKQHLSNIWSWIYGTVKQKLKLNWKKAFLRNEACNHNLLCNLVNVKYSWGHPSSSVLWIKILLTESNQTNSYCQHGTARLNIDFGL